MSGPDTAWGDNPPAGPCYLCGDERDHDGEPHGEATGDGLTREALDRRASALQAVGPDEFPAGYYRHIALEQLRGET